MRSLQVWPVASPLWAFSITPLFTIATDMSQQHIEHL